MEQGSSIAENRQVAEMAFKDSQSNEDFENLMEDLKKQQMQAQANRSAVAPPKPIV